MKLFTLKRSVITVSSVVAAISLSLFLILYVQDYSGSDEVQEGGSANFRVITTDDVCSYGELMFAYIGENNYLFNLDDESEPLIRQPVDMLLYASDDSVLYTTQT